jgi:hypothetical protein
MKRMVLAAAVAASVLAAPAAAGCFAPLGCTDNDFFRPADLAKLGCEALWKMRNTIFKERGFCFVEERAIAAFGNAGCRIHFTNALGLSSVERENLTNIIGAERRKHCPR